LKIPPQCSFFRLTIQTHIHPTESADKLEAALKNIIQLSTISVERQDNMLVGRSNQIESLSMVYEQARARRSVSVLRRMLLNNLERNTTFLLLNKQAAAAGVVALVDRENESPLGGIRIEIQCQPIQQVIDWLTYTIHGD
jgi:predicted RNA binding protein with dsRBD fold (UPF0201 family)